MTPEFAQAFVDFQSETGNIKKGNQGHNYNYADLASVIDYCKPILHKHGFAISQVLASKDGKPGLTTLLLHKTGSFIEGWIETPSSKLAGGASSAQCMGSAISYYRRYTLQSLLAIQADDDDGNKASAKAKTKPSITDESLLRDCTSLQELSHGIAGIKHDGQRHLGWVRLSFDL